MERILEGKRIFLVEDDVMNLSVFTVTLKQSGATMFQNGLGYGIIEQIETLLPIDLVLLDIMLARGLSGYDVFKQIRKNSRLVDIPVIAVTSKDPETEIPAVREAGMNGFIGKPISALQFAALVARVINGESVWSTGQ